MVLCNLKKIESAMFRYFNLDLVHSMLVEFENGTKFLRLHDNGMFHTIPRHEKCETVTLSVRV